jgi:hypothetical protein
MAPARGLKVLGLTNANQVPIVVICDVLATMTALPVNLQPAREKMSVSPRQIASIRDAMKKEFAKLTSPPEKIDVAPHLIVLIKSVMLKIIVLT